MKMNLFFSLVLLYTQHTTKAIDPDYVRDYGRDSKESRISSQDEIISQLLSSLVNSLELDGLTKLDFQSIAKQIGDSEDEDVSNIIKDQELTVKYPKCEGSDAQICSFDGEELGCGQPVRGGRIVNGNHTTPGAYPWAVGIQFGSKLYCGGSLITNKFVLTAAHCVKGFSQRLIKLILGDHDRRKIEAAQEIRTIEQVFINGFVKKTFNNDIALIKLNKKVTFSKYIRPVCLPTTDRVYDGQNTIVVGWGHLSDGGQPADILMDVIVPIIPQKKCRKETRYSASEITNNMICAGYDNGVLDACQGDSGGPMVWTAETDNFYTQIGIVSWGEGCAMQGYPGVYTRLGRYRKWIIDTVTDNGSCFCASD